MLTATVSRSTGGRRSQPITFAHHGFGLARHPEGHRVEERVVEQFDPTRAQTLRQGVGVGMCPFRDCPQPVGAVVDRERTGDNRQQHL